MDNKTGCKSHWYDKLYDVCRYSNGYSIPEAFYGIGGEIVDGSLLQHKTFSYVDQRSGRTVRLYGIVDRYSAGADADFLVSQIVSDILPFDRTTDHILNNDPSDREIYSLLDEVLRKVYRVDLNSSSASTRSAHGSDTRSPPGSPAYKNENSCSPESKNSSPLGNTAKPASNTNNSYMAPTNPVMSETVAQKLTVMEFINFYKDIIERVDEAADADERKHRDMTVMIQAEQSSAGMNQAKQFSAAVDQTEHFRDITNQPDHFQFVMNQAEYFQVPINQVEHFQAGMNQPERFGSTPYQADYSQAEMNNQAEQFPDASQAFDEDIMSPEQLRCTLESPLIGIAFQDRYYRKSATHLPRRRRGTTGRKLIARSTSLPTISESAEKWWDEESDSPIAPEQQQLESLPDNTVAPQSVPTSFQHTASLPCVEAARSEDDEFLNEISKVAEQIGLTEQTETPGAKYDDNKSCITGSPINGDSFSSYTAAAIVFIYGDKMFVGSIGDSRVILMRQKCHYLDIMYLNEPPLAWYPIAAAKSSTLKPRHYDILFQEPIVRGGFLVNESSIFLLMLNDGVVSNMLNVNEQYRTSNEINRSAAHMVIKIIERYASENIAEKFLSTIMHKCNRKFKSEVDDITGARREGMSFLFADLRQLIPRQLGYDQLLKNYKPKPRVNKGHSCPKTCEFANHLESDEETMKHASSINRIYDMLQEIFDREENERLIEENSANKAFENGAIKKEGFNSAGNSNLESQK